MDSGQGVSNLLFFGAGVVFTAIVVGLSFTSLNLVGNVNSSQQEKLNAVQEEYKLADVNLLEGQTVSAAEALSIARKYRSEHCTISKNSTVISDSTVLTRDTFETDTKWVVAIQLDVNDNLIGIDFVRPSGAVGEPDSVEAAKQLIINVAGGSYSDSWTTVQDRLKELSNNDLYRVNLAVALGMPSTSSWDEIQTNVASILSAAGSSVSCEKGTIPVGGSFTYSLASPKIAYLQTVSSKGLIIFEPYSYRIIGDFDDDTITVDLDSKTISGHSDTQISVMVVSD